jgi:Leucine-rich repeat (LRR) protein
MPHNLWQWFNFAGEFSMTIKELHNELSEAYSVNNLNTISLTLINLFRERNFTVLQRISDLISDYTDIRIGDDGKGFSRFMMLYHPDRAMYHLKEINRLASEENFDGLMEYAHILKLGRINEIATSVNNYVDIDYTPVYDWDLSDLDVEGFRIFDVNERATNKPASGTESKSGCTFFEAFRIREFGGTDMEYPWIYLGNIEDFELSSYGINDLEGIQFCTHARTMDLSNNMISDLLLIVVLKELEELNLSDNEVGFIDDLGNLKMLRTVNLSNNFIEDISPLFGLDNLEYADLSGNRIDPDQLDRLLDNGVVVDY